MRRLATRLAFVDLTRARFDVIEPDPVILVHFLGGRGLGAALVSKHGSGIEPLAAESLLCALAGPMTGTNLPLANRLCMVFRSPANGALAWANTGGYLAVALKNAGFDGLVLTFGEIGLLPPVLAAWTPPLVFAAVAVWLMLHDERRKVRHAPRVPAFG